MPLFAIPTPASINRHTGQIGSCRNEGSVSTWNSRPENLNLLGKLLRVRATARQQHCPSDRNASHLHIPLFEARLPQGPPLPSATM